MAWERIDRGRLRKTLPLLALAGALALSGCVDDGYGGYGAYGGGYYGDVYGGYDDYAAYGGWPAYGWYDGFYYPGTGFYVYDRGGHRRHWNGPGHGWNGGHGWAGGHGNSGWTGHGPHGWNGRPGGSGWHGGGPGGGGHGWHGPSGGAAHRAAPAPAPSRNERPR
ncbi:hypothetical protein [Sphingomonas sp. PR090111-T3T-6A]|uniref:hypothetical protein n=1 Tax=Sphingomonas sp. PR090111-T3T-6A TaxID=685778 RepID=UPI00036BB259|nr:hypothetical protein [Sphingomonas sp. PR090111-T3T-6A]